MNKIVKAFGMVVISPFLSGAAWTAGTVSLHWLSGEGEIHGSGDPILATGAITLVPVVIAGLLFGIAFAAVELWQDDPSPADED